LSQEYEMIFTYSKPRTTSIDKVSATSSEWPKIQVWVQRKLLPKRGREGVLCAARLWGNSIAVQSTCAHVGMVRGSSIHIDPGSPWPWNKSSSAEWSRKFFNNQPTLTVKTLVKWYAQSH
jgi:hypothetical protein